MSREYDEGRDAYFEEYDLESNPYDEGTEEWELWSSGWLEACEEDND